MFCIDVERFSYSYIEMLFHFYIYMKYLFRIHHMLATILGTGSSGK